VVVNKSGPQRGQEVSNDAELNRLSQGFIFLHVLAKFQTILYIIVQKSKILEAFSFSLSLE
jgi:hypothetical protein